MLLDQPIFEVIVAYHTNRANKQSLSDYSLANLEVIRDGVENLSNVLSDLRYRTIDFIDERKTKAYTKKLSRRDLSAIAKSLPALDHWGEPHFEEKKHELRSQYHLSEEEFFEAVEIVKANREMRALVGGQSSLLYLPDHSITFIARQWRKLHPPRGDDGTPKFVKFDETAVQNLKRIFSYKNGSGIDC